MVNEWNKHCTKVVNPELANQIVAKMAPLVEKMFIQLMITSNFLGYPPIRVLHAVYNEI